VFVLMDIEWIENSYSYISPTQIAAYRVDEQWQGHEKFYSRIAPRDSSFHQWKHMAFTGGKPSDFLYANGLHRVLTNLQNWLLDDDVICFWTEDSKNILKSIYNLILKIKVPHRIVVLSEYLFPFLKERKMAIGNAYRLCNEYGDQASGPKHHSENDVIAMQMALACIQFPSVMLNDGPPKQYSTTCISTPSVLVNIPDPERPYQLEIETNIFHKTGCKSIPAEAALTGHPNLKYFFRKNLIACPHCIKADVKKAIRERNQDIIDRTSFQYVYAENSDVFHRRGCPAVLNTTSTIKGSVYFDATASTGRRPCKLCNPTAGTWLSTAEKKKAKRIAKLAAKEAALKTAVPTRSMNAREQRAFIRYQEARTERLGAQTSTFQSSAEKDDFYTLTQPRFAFFCGAGYQTFHKRNCQKLHGLTNITGFSKYKDAIRFGHTPCKLCKPTSKLDIEYSIPITNKKRKGETIKDLESLCAEQGYSFEISDQYFCFVTSVGRWKIDCSSSPYIVYHINRARTPNNEYNYHRQPRLFLSLLDTFDYIQRHDKKLQERSCFDYETEVAIG